jgi:sensor domain CHASE-containing protein/HAMP domain-containing protein
MALYVVFQLLLQQQVVFPSFREMERRDSLDDLRRVSQAIANEIKHLDTTCHDWSAWDDTCDFVETGNPGYVEANLQSASLESANVDLMYFVHLDGRVVHRSVREAEEGAPPIDLEGFPEDHVAEGFELGGMVGIEDSIQGLLTTSSGPMLVASRPIVTSARTGPVRGYLVMGRVLDGPAIAALHDQIRVDFGLHVLRDIVDPSTSLGRARVAIEGGDKELLLPRDDQVMLAYAPILGIDGKPALLIETVIPRTILAEGLKVTGYSLASSIGAGALVLGLLLFLLQKTVVRPLRELTAHAEAIGRNDDLDARLGSERTDEIGVLAREFDGMVDVIARSRLQLVESAHEAGKSTVASEVLHNVGNALNSVNVSSGLVSSRLHRMNLQDLERLARAIDQHSGDLAAYLDRDERGKHIPEYLRQLVESLVRDRESALTECTVLTEGLVHMVEIVKAQQNHVERPTAMDIVSTSSELEAALRISGAATDGGVQIVREYQGTPRVRAQKHKLLQILVNLLRNARDAVDAGESTNPRIVMRLSTHPDGEFVRIEIQDNGVGIDPDNVVAIFGSGFTTKAGGHGLGLHSSANLAIQMGGRLTAHSEGLGKGSTFVLELPLEEQRVAA